MSSTSDAVREHLYDMVTDAIRELDRLSGRKHVAYDLRAYDALGEVSVMFRVSEISQENLPK